MSSNKWPFLAIMAALAIAAAAVTLDGCTLTRKLSGADQASAQRAKDLQELQLRVMRFADVYAGAVIDPVQKFQRATDNPEERLAAQMWKLSQSTAAYTIASGPNPVTNAVDMVVLATLSRMAMEDTWVGESYGERAVPLRDAHRNLEPGARKLLDGVLTPEQIAQLDNVIDNWRSHNPNVRAVTYVHFADLAKAIGRSGQGESAAKGGLFQLLGLDPLNGLDPAVRELAQTRQLAERTIYYAQRTPSLLDMQVEHLTYQIAAMPEIKRVLANVDTFSGAAASAGRLADDLPSVMAREREAAIDQFTAAIDAQSEQLRGLAVEMRGTLEAGTATSNSLNAAIRSFDLLMARFDRSGQAGAPARPPGRRFDITEYTAAAAEFARTAKELEQLAAMVEQGMPALSQTASRAAADLREVIDHAFWRLLVLGLLLIVTGLAATLAYRRIVRQWK